MPPTPANHDSPPPGRPVIRTLFGDVAPDSLGVILFHEHLHFSQEFLFRLRAQAPVDGFHFEDLDLITQEARAALRDGVTCIVDGGHADMGRDIGFLKEVSRRSGLTVVAGGGYYIDRLFPTHLHTCSVDEIAEALVCDSVAEGWGALGEIGSSHEITPSEHKVFQAVAKAHQRTGLPVFTHTEREGKQAVEQLNILESAGVDPAAVAIGHLGGMDSTSPHREIARRGAFVGFDRVSRRRANGDDTRQAQMVAELIEAGYLDRILVSGDQGSIRDDLTVAGGPGYAKPHTVFGPAMRRAGVTAAAVEHIMTKNPQRFLSFLPKADPGAPRRTTRQRAR